MSDHHLSFATLHLTGTQAPNGSPTHLRIQSNIFAVSHLPPLARSGEASSKSMLLLKAPQFFAPFVLERRPNYFSKERLPHYLLLTLFGSPSYTNTKRPSSFSRLRIQSSTSLPWLRYRQSHASSLARNARITAKSGEERASDTQNTLSLSGTSGAAIPTPSDKGNFKRAREARIW